MKVTIERERPVFTLVNTFEVDDVDRQQALVDELADVTQRITSSMPGFVAVAVHRSLDGHFVVNYVQWASRRDFDAMLADPRMKEHLVRVGALAKSVTPRFYQAAYVQVASSLYPKEGRA